VHKKSIVACVLVWDGKQAVEERKKEFGTMRRELERLRFWLMACKVDAVAMEATGVYWKPVWNVLEQQKQFQLKLINAQHFHGVDGQKTDQADAAWLAELLQCGLLKSSFVPPQEIRELRDLTRVRVALLEDQNRVQNRIEKILEDANIKLGSDHERGVMGDLSGDKVCNAAAPVVHPTRSEPAARRSSKRSSKAIKTRAGWPTMRRGDYARSARNWRSHSAGG